MNTIREKLKQKMGDTSKQEQRIQLHVEQRLAKPKQTNFKWLGSAIIIVACLLSIFLLLPNQKPHQNAVQQPDSVEIGGVMVDEKTGHEKNISDLLYDEVRALLDITKKEKLFYTPARYTNYNYVTTHCQATDCRILALQDNGTAGAIYNLGKGTIKAEVLSPDKKVVALVLHTKKQDTLHFMYTNNITDHPEASEHFPKIKTTKWLSNEKVQVTFHSGKTKIVTITRYY